MFLFFFFCFVYGFKNQNGKFLCLDKVFISCYLSFFKASKTKTASFRNFAWLSWTLFQVLLLRFWLQNQNGKFLCLDQTFVPCYFTWFMGYKIRNMNFLRLYKNFVSASFTSFMASKTKTVSFYGLLRPLFLVLVYAFNFQQGKFL